MSAFSDAGDAIVQFLDSQTFSLSLSTQRKNNPYSILNSTNELTCTVFPNVRSLNRDTRGDFERGLQIGVAVHKLVEADTEEAALAEEDSIMDVMEEVEEALATQQVFGNAQLESFDEDAGVRAALNEAMLQQSIFSAITLLNLRIEPYAWRAL